MDMDMDMHQTENPRNQKIFMYHIFAFIRLLIFTFPFLILPLIFLFGGFTAREYEEITEERFHMKIPNPGLQELYEAEFFINFLIYVLPFAFAFAGFEHLTKTHRLQVAFQDMMTMEDNLPPFINVKRVLFPIVGFFLFTLGKLLNLTWMWTKVDFIYTGLYINKYTHLCYILLVHLHILLAMYEFFLYMNFNYRYLVSYFILIH